jgi:hypothetical protein
VFALTGPQAARVRDRGRRRPAPAVGVVSTSSDERVGRRGSRNLGPYRTRALHLVAVWAYGVSQPIFSLIEGNASFLVLRDSTRADAVAFALLVALGVPLAAIAYVRLAALLSPWAGDMLYLAILAGFLAPIALRLVKSSDPGRGVAIVAALLLCVVGVACYVQWRPVRLFVGFSIVLPVVGVVSFVHGLPVTEEARAAQMVGVHPSARPPVVVVVFDEFSVSSLLTASGRIDDVRYPAFGRLVREGTWYPNATTVHGYTDHAVPAILTGQTPRSDELPILRDHPRNLFTLLGGSYPFGVHETMTRLCPRSLCPVKRMPFLDRLDALIGDVSDAYFFDTVPRSVTGVPPGLIPADKLFQRKAYATVREFDSFLGEISGTEPSGTLHFIHVLLPHVPWRFLPSGRRYGFETVGQGADAQSRSEAREDAWPSEQRLQRHLLQVQYTDALVRRLLDRLDEQGLFDRSLVVVTADHGVSFWPGADRRDATREHLSDIASIPLFVKFPRQAHGSTDLRPARTTDVLPTIADTLGVTVPWHVDGFSLLDSRTHPSKVRMLSKGGVMFDAPLQALRKQRDEAASRNARLFGEGLDSLYRIGTATEFLGVRTQEGVPASPTVRVRIEGGDRLRKVDPSSGFVPVHIAGVVSRGEVGPDTELAVAVNGRVWALTRCFRDENSTQRWRALVPEDALAEGSNRVDVYAIRPRAAGSRLAWLGSNVAS